MEDIKTTTEVAEILTDKSTSVVQENQTIVVEDDSAPELDYHVIASGSSGNAVRIGSVMIDCGIPFSKMKEDLYQCDTLLITHVHTDHLRKDTFEHIRKEFPRIKVYANADVAYRVQVDKVIGVKEFSIGKKRTVIPFDCHHDALCTGFIIRMPGCDVLYATDTNRIDDIDIPLDYVFLESNYDAGKLKELRRQFSTKGYDPLDSSFRHLSTQRCKEFYYVNRRNKNSILVELHKSSRFY